jgi:hypothetical protein
MLSILVLALLIVGTGIYLSWETKNRIPDRPYIYEDNRVGVMEVEIEYANAKRYQPVSEPGNRL